LPIKVIIGTLEAIEVYICIVRIILSNYEGKKKKLIVSKTHFVWFNNNINSFKYSGIQKHTSEKKKIEIK